MILLQIINVEKLTVHPILVTKEYEKLAASVHRKNCDSPDDGNITKMFQLLGGLRGFNISPELGQELDDDEPHYLDLDGVFWFFYR